MLVPHNMYVMRGDAWGMASVNVPMTASLMITGILCPLSTYVSIARLQCVKCMPTTTGVLCVRPAQMLATLSRWVDEVPPSRQSLRYGNPAYRRGLPRAWRLAS